MLVLGLVALYVIFQIIAPTYSWNQKLAVNIATPSGDVSGAAIVAIRVTSNVKFLPDAGGLHTSFQGEATMVDLGGGRYVFALLGSPPGLARATHAALLKAKDGQAGPFYAALRGLKGQPATVPASAYPTLVTFTDINDPKTVTKVDPGNIAASFGPRYDLKSITLEITDEPVTAGVVEKVLGWLNGLKGGYLQGGFMSGEGPLGTLDGGQFKADYSK